MVYRELTVSLMYQSVFKLAQVNEHYSASINICRERTETTMIVTMLMMTMIMIIMSNFGPGAHFFKNHSNIML